MKSIAVFLGSNMQRSYRASVHEIPIGSIRVHKNALVNRRHVDGIDGEGRVRLRNGVRVEISRRRLEEVTRELRG